MHQHIVRSRQAVALLASTAVVWFLAGPAAAQTSHICSAWNVDRSVEVITPEDGSAVCQVIYRKPDEDVADKILWWSARSVAFCEDKAQKLTARLAKAGFNCREGTLPSASPPAQTIAAADATRT